MSRPVRAMWMSIKVSAVALAAAGCNRGSSSTGSGSSGAPASAGKVGIDLPRSDSDFWNSYAKYINSDVTSMNIDALAPTNSQNDITKLASNVQALTAQGAKAIVMAPQYWDVVDRWVAQLRRSWS